MGSERIRKVLQIIGLLLGVILLGGVVWSALYPTPLTTKELNRLNLVEEGSFK